MLSNLRWSWLVIALVFAIACASPNTPVADPMEIELDAFSGRPNHGGYVTVTTNGATRTLFDSAGLEPELIVDASERGFGEVLTKRD